jgi:hypothetical protein
MPQWSWYAQMVGMDDKDHFDQTIDYIEYMASFWNAESVKKVKDARNTKKDGRFASDKEFEKQILENAFRDDELIKNIRDQYKNTNLSDTNTRAGARDTRLPKDLSGIRKLFED